MVSKKLHKCDGEERDCFLKEVKVLRSIRHKNVLRFIGVIYKDTNINLITEYVECGTLKELIYTFQLSHRAQMITNNSNLWLYRASKIFATSLADNPSAMGRDRSVGYQVEYQIRTRPVCRIPGYLSTRLMSHFHL